MIPYGSLADDHYVNMTLNTEMQLPNSRETVLEFFERMQRSYPSMKNFFSRENGDFVLEDDKDAGHQRWLSLEQRRVCSVFLNPPDTDTAIEQHSLVLQLVPYMLSVSPLDCEALDFMMGFDFNYRGNHDELVAEALGTGSALDGMRDLGDAKVLNFEPSMTISLDETCRLQARLFVETRTTPYQVRRSEFSDDQITVYFTVRKYGSLSTDSSFEDTLLLLRDRCDEIMEDYVIDEVLRPLQQAIATRQ